MNLYHIHNRRNLIGYDTLRSAVVRAESAEKAVEMLTQEYGSYSSFEADTVKVLAEDVLEEAEIVCSDYFEG